MRSWRFLVTMASCFSVPPLTKEWGCGVPLKDILCQACSVRLAFTSVIWGLLDRK